jgi:uncharacterized protein with NRDE domain
MCIAIISTAHPDYAFILLSNRDEVISRPTLPANWWEPPLDHVLGGRDLQRAERGTWLGITKQGRVAVLTNFREPDVEVAKDKSRGGIVNAYLKSSPGAREESEAEFVERLARDVGVHDVGGFTLAFGRLRAAKGSKRRSRTMATTEPEPKKSISSSSTSQTSTTHIASSTPTAAPTTEYPDILPSTHSFGHTLSYPGLALVSNRTPIPSASEPFKLPRILTTTHETHALSNSTFEDKTWPKTVQGCDLLQKALNEHAHNARGDESGLLGRLFGILSNDLLPQRQRSEDWETHGKRMRGSIFIDAEKGELSPASSSSPSDDDDDDDDGRGSSREHMRRLSKTAYGTMKQTVLLVDHDGHVVFVERTLLDAEGRRVPEGERERRFEFGIEGWWDEEDKVGEGNVVLDDVGKSEYDSPSLIIDAVEDEQQGADAVLDVDEAEGVSTEQAEVMTDESSVEFAEVGRDVHLEDGAGSCDVSNVSAAGSSTDDTGAERHVSSQGMGGSVALPSSVFKAKF